MTLPTRHPAEELLLDHAAGSLNEAFAAAIAAHLTFCPSCRELSATLDRVGGFAIEGAEPVALHPGALERALAALDAAPVAAPVERVTLPASLEPLPAPLRQLLAHHGAARRWSRPLPGIEMLAIGGADRPVLATLLRVAPGKPVPRHDHGGREITLVLRGAYRDVSGRYAVGDIGAAEPGVIHRPEAEEAGCLCFVASEGPSRFTGTLGMIQRLLGDGHA